MKKTPNHTVFWQKLENSVLEQLDKKILDFYNKINLSKNRNSYIRDLILIDLEKNVHDKYFKSVIYNKNIRHYEKKGIKIDNLKQ